MKKYAFDLETDISNRIFGRETKETKRKNKIKKIFMKNYFDYSDVEKNRVTIRVLPTMNNIGMSFWNLNWMKMETIKSERKNKIKNIFND
jgi:hypothetical protein